MRETMQLDRYFDVVTFSQLTTQSLYAAARDSYGRRSEGAAAFTQLLAAEASMHARWLLGVEPSCTCLQHALIQVQR